MNRVLPQIASSITYSRLGSTIAAPTNLLVTINA